MPSRVDGAARWVGATADVVRFLVRSFGPFDTNPVPSEWAHVTKVDPEDEKRLPLLYHNYLRHSDAVSVGGSSDVTARNTAETLRLLEPVSDLPVFHEPSAASHVDEQTRELCDFLAIPEVLNGDAEALVGVLGRGAEYVKEELAPNTVAGKLPARIPERWGTGLADFATWWMLAGAVFEAYIIQNPDSAAAREGNVTAADVLSPSEARRRALAAEKHLSSEIVYVEYSGTFGGKEGLEVISAVDDAVSWSRVWYGGGLDTRRDVERVLDAGADAVVVGDVFHDVTEDERRCYERAKAAGVAAASDEVRAWLDGTVDVEGTAACRFLSTIPSVEDPREWAATYLSKAVHVLLWADDRDAETEPSGDEVPGVAALPAKGSDDGNVPSALAAEPVRAWAADRLGARTDLGRFDSTLPVSHVGPARTADDDEGPDESTRVPP